MIEEKIIAKLADLLFGGIGLLIWSFTIAFIVNGIREDGAGYWKSFIQTSAVFFAIVLLSASAWAILQDIWKIIR